MEHNSDLQSSEEIQNDKDAEARAQKDLDVVRAYKTVFNSVDGGRVMYDLMKSCSFTTSTFSQGDALGMAHNEGRRSVLLDIIKVLNKDEADTLEFLKQSTEKDKGYFL